MNRDRKLLIIVLLLWGLWIVKDYIHIPTVQVHDDSYVKMYKTYLEQGKQQQVSPEQLRDSLKKAEK